MRCITGVWWVRTVALATQLMGLDRGMACFSGRELLLPPFLDGNGGGSPRLPRSEVFSLRHAVPRAVAGSEHS